GDAGPGIVPIRRVFLGGAGIGAPHFQGIFPEVGDPLDSQSTGKASEFSTGAAGLMRLLVTLPAARRAALRAARGTLAAGGRALTGGRALLAGLARLPLLTLEALRALVLLTLLLGLLTLLALLRLAHLLHQAALLE